MPACPARPCTVMRGSRLPRQATHTARPLGSGTMAASACSSARGEQPARAGRLLLGDRVDDQVAGERNAELGQRAGRDDHARDPALHVARPAAVEQAVAQLGRERIGHRPVRARLDVDDVDVAVEQQRPPAAAAAEARDELRAALERELARAPSGAVAARSASGSCSSTSAPWDSSSAARCSCSARSCRGAAPGRVRHGVERHELARERDEGLAARRHGVDDALLLGRELHDGDTVARVSVSFAGHELHSPRFALEEARELARERFGVDGAASELGSHQDQNALIDGPSGRFVLKIANAAFGEAELDLQNRAMVHLARASAAGGPATLRGARRERDRRRRARGRDLPGAARDVRRGRAADRRAAPRARRSCARSARSPGSSPSRSRASSTRPPTARCSGTRGMSARSSRRSRRTSRIRAAARSPSESRPAAAEAIERLAPRLRTQIAHCDVTDWNVIGRRDRAGPARCPAA